MTRSWKTLALRSRMASVNNSAQLLRAYGLGYQLGVESLAWSYGQAATGYHGLQRMGTVRRHKIWDGSNRDLSACLLSPR